MKNVYQFCSTIGFPLECLLDQFKERDIVVDWIDYYNSALKLGMASERVLTRMEYDIVDVYGSQYKNEVMKKLNEYIELKRVK